MYFPNPIFHKFLSSGFDASADERSIEPSYRFESDSKEAFLEVELPGVAKEDISVDVNNHHLTVTAKRAKQSLLQKNKKKETNVENESDDKDNSDQNGPTITYALNVRIGHDADVSNISSVSYKNGLLVLRIPSQTKDNGRRITVT